MAKFKVGDKVKVIGQFKATGNNTGNVVTIVGVEDSYGMTQYELKYADGMKLGHIRDSELIVANSAPRSTNPVVQNALAVNATGCLDEYKSRARGAVNAGYNLLREKVALVESDAERLADLSRSRDDKNGWAVIRRKQSLLEDMVEKFWKDAQRIIDS